MKTHVMGVIFLSIFVFFLFFVTQAFAWRTADGDYGWTCFPAGTKIFMADKTEKKIEDVVIGDRIMGYDGKRMMPAVVEELEAPIRDHLFKLTFSDDTTIRLTNEHPLFTKEGWKSINPKKTFEENPQLHVTELKVGDSVFNTKGTYTKIVSMLYIPGKVQTYNLRKVSMYRNFFADSYLAHNKQTTYLHDGDGNGSIGEDCPARGCGSQGGGDEDEARPVCVPLTCASYNRGCGLAAQAYVNGCGGTIICPATAPCCHRMALRCSTQCGLARVCSSDGCGGQNCCNATAACPTPTPAFCGAGHPSCPAGQECYQPPMPPCTSGACAQVMPQQRCRPILCPKRPQGDANCDQVINNADYESVFKPKMNGQAYPCPNCTADFNSDGKVNLVDYEIWRNTLTISANGRGAAADGATTTPCVTVPGGPICGGG